MTNEDRLIALIEEGRPVLLALEDDARAATETLAAIGPAARLDAETPDGRLAVQASALERQSTSFATGMDQLNEITKQVLDVIYADSALAKQHDVVAFLGSIVKLGSQARAGFGQLTTLPQTMEAFGKTLPMLRRPAENVAASVRRLSTSGETIYAWADRAEALLGE